jgi:hypothetical protein
MDTNKVLIVKGRLLEDSSIQLLRKLVSPPLLVEIFTEGYKLLSTMSELDPSHIPLVIVDIKTEGDSNGFSLMRQHNALFPHNTSTRFILLGDYPAIDEKMAINLGAYFLKYPLDEAASCRLIQACLNSPRRYSHKFLDSFTSTSSTLSRGNK